MLHRDTRRFRFCTTPSYSPLLSLFAYPAKLPQIPTESAIYHFRTFRFDGGDTRGETCGYPVAGIRKCTQDNPSIERGLKTTTIRGDPRRITIANLRRKMGGGARTDV